MAWTKGVSLEDGDFTMKTKNVLLTGSPGCGKSTVIEKLIKQIQRPVIGFFTREIKEKERRVGFAIITLDGNEGVLAHEKSKSRMRVGKYAVNIDELDRIAVPSMIPSTADQIVIIDEIGKMECFSPLFRETLIKTLDSANPVIGSIAQKGSPFIEKIKERKDVLWVTVSEKNRDSLPADLLEKLTGRPSFRPYRPDGISRVAEKIKREHKKTPPAG